jgi:hypothetical protein
MAMTEREWHLLLAKNRRSVRKWASGAQTYLLALAVMIWVLALAPTVCLVVYAVEHSPGFALPENHPPNQARSQ